MRIELPENLQKFIRQLVADGRYDSEASAVIDGVRILEAQERLRAEIQVGLDELDAGQGLSEEEVFSDIRAELDQMKRERPGHQL